MKHYSKAQLETKVETIKTTIIKELAIPAQVDSASEVETWKQLIDIWLSEHKQEQALLDLAKTKGIATAIEIVQAATVMSQVDEVKNIAVVMDTVADKVGMTVAEVKTQAEAEDKNPAHVKARKEAKERKATKHVDKPVEKKTRKPQQRKKVSNFDNVDKGICPHCQEATLDKEVAGKGDGVTRTCKKCQHKWYLNRKIRTCKCLTCPKAEKKV